MRLRDYFGVIPAVVLGITFSVHVSAGTADQTAPPPAGQAAPRPAGWTLPPSASEEKNPLPASDAVVAAGKKLFADKCQRCHGPEAKGDGPEGDKAHVSDMNLTLANRAARNPDGVVFYKIWNGRGTPKMPAFSTELTKEQVWAIVAYVQTLRAKGQ
jgi:mono/diheme cytochrome c family protein